MYFSDGNLTENIVQCRLRSPSQSSASSELLIWSKEGSDYDWELLPVSSQCDDELSSIQSSLIVEFDSSFTPVSNDNFNTINDDNRAITVIESNLSHSSNSSSNSNNSSGTKIYSYNHNCLTGQSSTSPSTSQSCSYYMNGSSFKPKLPNSPKTEVTKTPINGLFLSSPSSKSLSLSSKKVINNRFISSSNLYDQRNINTLADDFIDLDIKTIPTTSNCSITTSYHPDFDYMGLPESPIQYSPNLAPNQKSLPSSSFISNNSITVQKSNVISQSPETEIIQQTSLNPEFYHKLPSVNETSTSKTNVAYNNNRNNDNDNNNTTTTTNNNSDSLTNAPNHEYNQNRYNKNNNNGLFHCQSSKLIEHSLSLSDNESDKDLPGYSFLSSSSSSASSCMHIPSACNNINHNTNNNCFVNYVGNNEENVNQCHRSHEDNKFTALSLHNSISLPFMLIPTSELTSGDSLTCTVVNILRCLGLLDRCGVEDLCASLYDFWNHSCYAPFHPVHSFFKSHVMYPTSWESSRIEEPVVTRSSSFTSYTLVDPRRSTVPGENYGRNYQMLINCRGSKPFNGGCLVNYILSCSYMGTSFLASHSIYDLNNLSSPCCPRPSTSCCYFAIDRTNQISSCNSPTIYHPNLIQPIYNSTMDWRRGCADNLVLMLTHHSPASVVDKLLTGRFFPGPTSWRSVWPFIHKNNPKCFDCSKSKNNNIMSNSLILWFSAWLYCGAIPVLAQLCDSVYSNEQCLPSDVSQPSCKSSNYSAQELVWSHRLVYGVTENNCDMT
ncbi:unnamed protein product [Schistosoma turkestanicum]|nr:unnamed protein product [Schistosoma turkestanicum]